MPPSSLTLSFLAQFTRSRGRTNVRSNSTVSQRRPVYRSATGVDHCSQSLPGRRRTDRKVALSLDASSEYLFQRGFEHRASRWPSRLSPEGKAQTAQQVAFYLENARIINEGLQSLDITTYGGGNAPLRMDEELGRVEFMGFFDKLLNECHVVGTPGSGFGPGRRFFRLSAFGHRENVERAVRSIRENLDL